MLLKKHLFTFTFAALALADSFTLRTTTSTVLKCSTSYGAKSVAPPLKTATATKSIKFLPSIGTSIYTPISTITPSSVTTTSTVQTTVTVTTTDSTVTDTFSTTSTILTTETLSTAVTITSTETASFSTTTTTGVTTTIPTSNGFLPVESTTATAYPDSPSRRFMARDKKTTPKEKGICGSSYPQSVTCIKYVEYFTTIIFVGTAKPTTTTLAPATSTATITITATTISTEVPLDVSTTISFTTTQTIPITATSTSITTTTTSTTSTLTTTSTTSSYAACTSSSSNILGPETPNGLVEAITGSNSFIISNPGSPYDCCVDCQLSNTCAGTFYSVGSQDTVGQCIQVQSGQCSSQGAFSRGYQANPVDNGFTYIVSNGNCGYLYYAGQFN